MRAVLAFVLSVLGCLGSLRAQQGSLTTDPGSPGSAASSSLFPQGPFQGGAAGSSPLSGTQSRGPSLTLNLSPGATKEESLSGAIELVLLMTILALAPAIVLTMTCFTRIIIVISFLKRAMAMQELPPATVVTGFAVFLSIFLMKPVVADIHENAWKPYTEKQIGFETMATRATERMNQFLLRQTRSEDVELILSLSKDPRPQFPKDTPFHVTVPAFILSEVKTAFQMGFVLFLPFVVIDLVISSILVSMGMFTLPPVVISTPLKLLLFILVDGWNLLVTSLAESFATI